MAPVSRPMSMRPSGRNAIVVASGISGTTVSFTNAGFTIVIEIGVDKVWFPAVSRALAVRE